MQKRTRLIGNLKGLDNFPISYDNIGFITPENRDDHSIDDEVNWQDQDGGTFPF